MSERNFYSGNRFRGALRAFFFGRVAQGIITLLLTLWIIRLLATDDYGAYMVLWGMVEMLVPLSSLGLLEAVRRFLPELATRGTASGVQAFVKWTSLARVGILVVWMVGLLWGWEVFAGWLDFTSVQVEQAWCAVILAVLVVAFRYACEMLECLLEQRWSQVVRAVHPLGRLVGLVGLVLVEQVSLMAVLWLDVVVSLVCLLLAEWALIRKLRTLPDAGDYQVAVGEVAGFAWNIAGVNLLQSTASEGAQRLLAARLLGLEVAGLFSFLQQLLVIALRYMPSQLLGNLIRPMLISRLASGEVGIVSQTMALMWKSNLAIVLASIVGLVTAGDALVAQLSSGRFVEAGLPVLLLFIGLGAMAQGQVVNMAMQIHDKTRALRQQSVLFLFLPLAAWLGAAQGVEGFIAGIVLVHWLRNAFALWWMRRQGICIRLDTAGIVRMMAMSLIAAGGGCWLAYAVSPWGGLAIALLLFAAGMLLIRPLSRVDGELLVRMFKGKERYLKLLVWKA